MERKIIVITPERVEEREVDAIAEMLENGCDRVHVRKPGADPGELRRYLDRLCRRVDPARLSMHRFFDTALEYGFGGLHGRELPTDFGGTASCSCHSLSELWKAEGYDYAFVSPVFDSISKQGYRANIDLREMAGAFRAGLPCEVFALGGVEAARLGTLAEAGFRGIALLGGVWGGGAQEAPARFLEIEKLWK